ncbi:hypothetical protein [Chromatium okenii]|uniref:hypothetical protein n=1 Tax=Chromatium okenii TaxID=61644 RepID=UPI001F5B7BD3|nr:hypothetical protein [Chromatium okenii]
MKRSRRLCTNCRARARLLDDEPLTAADHELLQSLDKSSFFDKSPNPPLLKGGFLLLPP